MYECSCTSGASVDPIVGPSASKLSAKTTSPLLFFTTILSMCSSPQPATAKLSCGAISVLKFAVYLLHVLSPTPPISLPTPSSVTVHFVVPDKRDAPSQPS